MDNYFYYDEDDERHEISGSLLPYIDKEIQEKIMEAWFYSNFEDPGNCCPYISREGGYQYVWGGPYEAEQELLTEFEPYIDGDVIEKLANKFSGICPEWSKNSNHPSLYDDYDYTNLDPYTSLMNSLEDLEILILIEMLSSQQNVLFKMVFVNSITILETYLCDIFIEKITKNDELLRLFTTNYKDFKKKDIKLSDIFINIENIGIVVKRTFQDFLWHKLPNVREILKNCFGFELQNEPFIFLCKAVNKRHDLVHRNGKTSDGDIIDIEENEIEELITNIKLFVNDIEEQFDTIPGWRKEDCPDDCPEKPGCDLVPGSKKCKEVEMKDFDF